MKMIVMMIHDYYDHGGDIYDYYDGDHHDHQDVGDDSLIPTGGFKR